jgi:cob(I)alamin adenosyltransferase
MGTPKSISTKRGDRGTTGLLYGGRVRKDSARVECNGAVDEAQAALGYARAIVRSTVDPAERGGRSQADLDALLVGIERDLWVLMAEVATETVNRPKLVGGVTLVTDEMVGALTAEVHALEASQPMPTEFVVPGENLAAAALDVARTVVRRAERWAVRAELPTGSAVVPYLNRLSDLCWLLARAVEGQHPVVRSVAPSTSGRPAGRSRSSREGPGSRRRRSL